MAFLNIPACPVGVERLFGVSQDRLVMEMRLRARKVTVEERLDGSLHITGDGAGPKYKEGTERPEKQTPAKQPRRFGKKYLPPNDHPLRRWRSPETRPPTADIKYAN